MAAHEKNQSLFTSHTVLQTMLAYEKLHIYNIHILNCVKTIQAALCLKTQVTDHVPVLNTMQTMHTMHTMYGHCTQSSNLLQFFTFTIIY